MEDCYEFLILPDQWYQSWKRLCDHCTGIYHGIRYRKDVKLCTWRCYHDRLLCGIPCHERSGMAATCGSCSVCYCLYGSWYRHRKIAYKPLRRATPLAVLITAIGVSYFLQNAALLLFGADTKSFTNVVTLPSLKLAGGSLTISGTTIVTVLACVIIMAGLMIFIKKTKAGQAMLAVSEDKDAAQLMGVNVNATISLTFAIGSGLAAIAGVLFCSAYPTLTPYTGSMPGIKAFTAAVFGGIGSIPGALIGGILLGIIEILGRAYISSQLSDAIVFAVLIIVLLVKPTGILGKQIHEKV